MIFENWRRGLSYKSSWNRSDRSVTTSHQSTCLAKANSRCSESFSCHSMSWIQLSQHVDTTNLSPRNIFGLCFAICYSVAMYTICNFYVDTTFFSQKMSILVNDTCNFCPFGSELCLSGCQLRGKSLGKSLGNLVDGRWPEGLSVTVLAALALGVQTQPNPWQKIGRRSTGGKNMQCICLDLDPHRIQSV